MEHETLWASLLLRAETEPIGLDISNYSDEWCEGFLAGQVSILEEIEASRLDLPEPILTISAGSLSALRRIARSRNCNVAAALEEVVGEFDA